MSNNIPKTDKKIGFIGAGKMASAIIGGIVKSEFAPSENIFAYDINDNALSCAKENLVASFTVLILILNSFEKKLFEGILSPTLQFCEI